LGTVYCHFEDVLATWSILLSFFCIFPVLVLCMYQENSGNPDLAEKILYGRFELANFGREVLFGRLVSEL
jgi:hypothetical protein